MSFRGEIIGSRGNEKSGKVEMKEMILELGKMMRIFFEMEEKTI